ncbi:hypothetical protein [Nocardioides sp. KR10-350]|uniref:hypothetical protein n=1 Tax=Nocardioides cheoyonin TaxID=3156615 RepID=UPI0032B3AA3B
MTGLLDAWGATEAEARRGYPADNLLPAPVRRLTRAVSVAPPDHPAPARPDLVMMRKELLTLKRLAEDACPLPASE